MYETLEEVREDVARRLAKAVKERHLPMHTPVVATADADARVMVLRDFDPDSWRLRFHTDARSPKTAVIGDGEQGRAPITVLFYDKPAKVQIRAHGEGWIERDTELADEAWAASTNFARRCYLGDGPGAAADAPTSGLPDWAEGIEPSEEQVAAARANFAILLIELNRLDWFYLAQAGHRRAQFTRDGDRWTGGWVAP